MSRAGGRFLWALSAALLVQSRPPVFAVSRSVMAKLSPTKKTAVAKPKAKLVLPEDGPRSVREDMAEHALRARPRAKA